MSPSKLLRHVFRHVPHAREHAAPQPNTKQDPTVSRSPTPNGRISPLGPSALRNALPLRAPTPLDNIAEESEPESESASHNQRSPNHDEARSPVSSLTDLRDELSQIIYDESSVPSSPHSTSDAQPFFDESRDASITTDDLLTSAMTSLDIDPSTYTTRKFICATLLEAKTALLDHLDTLNTTLALLETLIHLSATITVLKDEMTNEAQRCRRRLSVIQSWDTALGAARHDNRYRGSEERL